MALLIITEELLKQIDVVGALTVHYGGMKELRMLRNPAGMEGGTRTYYVDHPIYKPSYVLSPTVVRSPGGTIKIEKDE